MSGILYICGTPIGNLGDITHRQLEVLRTVDLIGAEDTRNTLKLLNHFDIKNKLTSYHEHNAHEKGQMLIKLLKEGKNIALVSDAGMPAISDPGEDLVRLCKAENIEVTTVPGGTAVVSALVLSGFDTSKYVFYGFLPADKKIQKMILERLKNDFMTSVLYESPHRIIKTLNILKDHIGGEREVAIARELTKKFEEILNYTISEMIAHFEQNPPRGEMVIIIKGHTIEEIKETQIEEFEKISILAHMDIYLNKGIEQKEAIKLVAKDRGVGKRDIYNEVMKK